MSIEKRKRWRAQEEALVARWNAAVARHARVSAELASGGRENHELAAKMQSAQAELETVRREVARIKVAFNTGTRY